MRDRALGPMVLRILAVALTLLVVTASPWSSLRAQERTGHVYGRVVDGGGGVVVGETVTITDTRTGSTRQVTTNSEGNYSAPKMPTGTFKVEIELPGFKKFARQGVILGGGTIAEINVTLEPGGSNEVVEVVDKPILVNT